MTIDDLPAAARDRVLESMGGADVIEVSEGRLSGPGGRSYTVTAILPDKVVNMILGVAADGAVAENTTVFPISRILEVDLTGDAATIHIEGPDRRYRMTVSATVARALIERRWDDHGAAGVSS